MQINDNQGNSQRRKSFSDWSCCAKFSSICCCLSALVLVVLIPLTPLVIVPDMAQATMSNTVVTLNNATLVLPADFFTYVKNLTLVNVITLDVPGPLGAKIHAFRATLHSNGKEMGYFEFPELDAKVGKNEMSFSKMMTITNKDAAITFATFMLGVGAKQNLEITGDPTVTALGFLDSTPHQDNNLTCVGLGSSYVPLMAISMKCAKGDTKLKTAKGHSLISHEALTSTDLPDCSKTACPAKCQCGTEKCASQIKDCLADASCAAGETCANACPCGSMACLAACAAKHPTAKGFAVLSCVQTACPGTEKSSLVAHIKSKALTATDLPDCTKTACPAKCQCGTEKCASQIKDCLADASCAAGETCANACPCGSTACLAGCAAKHPTAKGFAVLSCVQTACPNNELSELSTVVV